jgi:hypothetical protein
MTDDIPPLVPLQCALEFLHTGDAGALRRPLRYGRYDPKTLDRLFPRLGQSGARVRGNIDGAPETWIGPLELLNDYRISYGCFMKVGCVARLESRIAYPADLVRYRRQPVRHPDAVEASYRLIVSNVKIEAEPLLRWVVSQHNIDLGKPAVDAAGLSTADELSSAQNSLVKEGRQTRRARQAVNGCFPNGVPENTSTEKVVQECTVWLEQNDERQGDGKILPPPSYDVYARLLGRRID